MRGLRLLGFEDRLGYGQGDLINYNLRDWMLNGSDLTGPRHDLQKKWNNGNTGGCFDVFALDANANLRAEPRQLLSRVVGLQPV